MPDVIKPEDLDEIENLRAENKALHDAVDLACSFLRKATKNTAENVWQLEPHDFFGLHCSLNLNAPERSHILDGRTHDGRLDNA